MQLFVIVKVTARVRQKSIVVTILYRLSNAILFNCNWIRLHKNRLHIDASECFYGDIAMDIS